MPDANTDGDTTRHPVAHRHTVADSYGHAVTNAYRNAVPDGHAEPDAV
jgi:hypothetical protein